MKLEINYFDDIITIKIYDEKTKNEIKEDLNKQKKVYEIYNELDEDFEHYYLIVIYRNLIKEF